MRPVLVVEDERDLRDTVAEVLECEGYHVAKAADGLEALQLARATPPCLILLDLMMPVMNGWQVMEALGGDRRLSSTPVVIVSASHDPPPGARGFLAKPFQIDELVAIVLRFAGDERRERPGAPFDGA